MFLAWFAEPEFGIDRMDVHFTHKAMYAFLGVSRDSFHNFLMIGIPSYELFEHFRAFDPRLTNHSYLCASAPLREYLNILILFFPASAWNKYLDFTPDSLF